MSRTTTKGIKDARLLRARLITEVGRDTHGSTGVSFGYPQGPLVALSPGASADGHACRPFADGDGTYDRCPSRC